MNHSTVRITILASLCAGLSLGLAVLTHVQSNQAPDRQPPGVVHVPIHDVTAAEELAEAQAQVETLEHELLSARTSLADNEQRIERAKAWRDEELARLNAEVARLEVALVQAVAERDALREELTVALASLDEAIDRRGQAEQTARVFEIASTANLWEAFTENVKVQACERGTKRSLDRCQERVEDHFESEARYARFADCVQDHGTVPVLMAASRGVELPANSEVIDPAGVLAGSHAVVWCDPELPEGVLASAGPVVAAY